MTYGFERAQGAAHTASTLEALLRGSQHALDEVIGDRGNSLAFFGRNVLPFAEVLTNQRLAVLLEVRVQIIHDRTRFESGSPRFEFGEVFVDQRFRTRNFGFAGPLVLLDDLAEVVDVVEVKIVEPGSFGSHVAWHAKIDHEDGTAIASLQHALEQLARHYRAAPD